MKHLIIVGAGGWGREVSWLATNSIGYGTEFCIKGFIDDRFDALDGLGDFPPIIGSIGSYMPQKDDVFTIALGIPKVKKKCAMMMIEKQAQFINLIHKNAGIHKNAHIGRGCIVDAWVSISPNAVVGDFVTIQRDSVVGHDAIVGNYSMLNSFSFMGGFSKIGEESELGTHSQIIPRLTVGENCVVGAGSVVIRRVKDNTTVFGVPAKRIEY